MPFIQTQDGPQWQDEPAQMPPSVNTHAFPPLPPLGVGPDGRVTHGGAGNGLPPGWTVRTGVGGRPMWPGPLHMVPPPGWRPGFPMGWYGAPGGVGGGSGGQWSHPVRNPPPLPPGDIHAFPRVFERQGGDGPGTSWAPPSAYFSPAARPAVPYGSGANDSDPGPPQSGFHRIA